MTGPHRPLPGFPARLESLYRQFPFERSLRMDPLSCVRPLAVDQRSAESAGLFAATIAVGNTTAIRASFGRLLARASGNFRTAVETMDPEDWRAVFRPFRHRWIRDDQLGFLARRLQAIWREYGTLEDLFLSGFEEGGFSRGLDRISLALRGSRGGPSPDRSSPPRGYRALFPTPLGVNPSPCKRLTLFVRWMVRSEYPDLGVWRRIPPSELRVPLDQHVFWIAYHLGLTARRTARWSTVEEITGRLREIDPVDPVKFDFVLCHTGISGDCPKRRDIRVCGPCVVRPDCLMWHDAPRGAS